MERITPIPAKRLRKVFERAGFRCVRSEGEHCVYTKTGVNEPPRSKLRGIPKGY
jgi:predicted RNA binding protein YcfA (HicA-like mRNA interferase family)